VPSLFLLSVVHSNHVRVRFQIQILQTNTQAYNQPYVTLIKTLNWGREREKKKKKTNTIT